MKMNWNSIKRAGILLGIILCIIGDVAAGMEGSRPNILFYLSDDQSKADHRAYGNPQAPTPTTEVFAKEGLVFDRAYTGQAICAPSRTMLYSGLNPIRHGCFVNHTQTRPGVKTITHYMRKLGYEVILAGKSHVGPSSQYQWTKHYPPVEVEGLPRPWIPIKEIDEYFSNSGKKPFCMLVTSEFPHSPHIKDTEFEPDDVKLPPFYEPSEKNLEDYTRYYASIAEKEKEFAAVLASLEKHGLEDDTIVFYSDDHGAQRAKFTVYDTGLNVAFMVRWPGNIKPGRTSALTSFADFIPTIIELGGGDVPDILDGKSLIPVLAGKTNTHHKYVYGVTTNQGIQRRSIFPQRSVHDGRYHYIFNFNSLERLERDRAAGKEVDFFREYGAKKYKYKPEEELYDTQVDPFELNNLADNVAIVDLKKRLKSELFRHMKTQNDFLTEDGSLPVLKVKQHELDESNQQYNYVIPKKLEGTLDDMKQDPHEITGGAWKS